MQIHRQNTVDTNGLEHIGNHFGGDGHSNRARATILTCVAVIRHHSSDTACRSSTQRINHNHQFHQIVIGGRAGALQDEDIATADLFVNFHHDFTVREMTDNSFTKGNIEMFCDCMGKFGIGIARKNHEIVRNHWDHDMTRRKLGRENSSVSIWRLKNRFVKNKRELAQQCLLPKVGRGGRIRTFECRNQNPVP